MLVEGKKILVTGGAGFIGSHLCEALLANGNEVVVLDNFNDFYDPAVKRRNLANCATHANFTLVEGDLRDERCLNALFLEHRFDTVVHLAAMAGVRPSLERPSLYMDVNVIGTQNLLNQILQRRPQALLIFGSSSSVYGQRFGESFKETDRVDQPLSPYAASKIAGELACYAAHHTFGLNVICLRFFTVFGPRQRPDLAIHKFCRLIDDGKPIEVYGDGSSKRDYTFVSDIVDGILSACSLEHPGYDIINLGWSEPMILRDMIAALEQALNKKAKIIARPMQMGDVPYTYANVEKARKLLGFEPKVDFTTGINRFVEWHIKEREVAAVT